MSKGIATPGRGGCIPRSNGVGVVGMSEALQKRFECPECGGSMFGTSGCTGDTPQGHCHDFTLEGHPCRFTWDRTTEDKHCFK